jgi:hypothetical protein
MNEASVGTSPAGSIDVGWMSPATEKPTAVKTLMAVISEATRIAVVRDGRIDIQESSLKINIYKQVTLSCLRWRREKHLRRLFVEVAGAPEQGDKVPEAVFPGD